MGQNYDGYFITSCGKIWSYYKKGFMKTMDSNGYQRVQMKDGKHLVHRLVAETYLPNSDNLSEVDHINGNRADNRVQNLQWISKKDNIAKAWNKPCECVETGQVFESRTAAAEFLGVSKEAIMNCLRGKSKTCGGYHWRDE